MEEREETVLLRHKFVCRLIKEAINLIALCSFVTSVYPRPRFEHSSSSEFTREFHMGSNTSCSYSGEKRSLSNFSEFPWKFINEVGENDIARPRELPSIVINLFIHARGI